MGVRHILEEATQVQLPMQCDLINASDDFKMHVAGAIPAILQPVCELWSEFMRCFGLLGDTSKILTHTRKVKRGPNQGKTVLQ
jgi:hypothetical protein